MTNPEQNPSDQTPTVQPKLRLTFSEAARIRAERLEQQRAAVRKAKEEYPGQLTELERRIIDDFIAGVPVSETIAALEIQPQEFNRTCGSLRRKKKFPLPRRRPGPPNLRFP